MTRPIFVTGTDTEVGKTYVASALARGFVQQGRRVAVYKPVASGCIPQDDGRESEDAVSLWQAAGRPLSLKQVCPQLFLAPVSPARSAALEQSSVDRELLVSGLACWNEGFDVVITEGAGGFMSPLADGFLNVDFAQAIDADVILVAANRLGVINHTLLTLEVCRKRLDRDPLAIILSQASADGDLSLATNATEIAQYAGDVPIHELKHAANPSPEEISKIVTSLSR